MKLIQPIEAVALVASLAFLWAWQPPWLLGAAATCFLTFVALVVCRVSSWVRSLHALMQTRDDMLERFKSLLP